MIRTLADDATRDIWNGVNTKAARRIPRELWPIVRRKLDQIDAVTRLEDLKVPPGKRLHALHRLPLRYCHASHASPTDASWRDTPEGVP